MTDSQTSTGIPRRDFYITMAVTWGFMLNILTKQLRADASASWGDYVFFGATFFMTMYFVVSSFRNTKRPAAGTAA